MKATTGLVIFEAMNSAACSSSVPPISPIITTFSVCGSCPHIPRAGDISGDDANLGLAGRQQTGAVRSNQAGNFLIEVITDAHHILHGHALRDADDEGDASVGSFVH